MFQLFACLLNQELVVSGSRMLQLAVVLFSIQVAAGIRGSSYLLILRYAVFFNLTVL